MKMVITTDSIIEWDWVYRYNCMWMVIPNVCVIETFSFSIKFLCNFIFIMSFYFVIMELKKSLRLIIYNHTVRLSHILMTIYIQTMVFRKCLKYHCLHRIKYIRYRIILKFIQIVWKMSIQIWHWYFCFSSWCIECCSNWNLNECFVRFQVATHIFVLNYIICIVMCYCEWDVNGAHDSCCVTVHLTCKVHSR